MPYNGIRYFCRSCGDMYAYKGKCAGCGTKLEKIENEPDIDAILDERQRPTYREQAIMERGIEPREGK